MMEELESLTKSPLFELIGIDPTDVAEIPCGIKFCTGPALADEEHWVGFSATASLEGEEVGSAESKVPVCPLHALMWELIFDLLDADLLVQFALAFVELGHLPIIEDVST